MLQAKVAARSRHAGRLKFGRIERQEGAILGVSADTSQISKLEDAVNPFLYLLE